jgi:ribosome-binding factor A
MANYRRGRINDEVTKEVAQILREVKDPRVRNAFVSVTGAEVTPDLKYAKIYYSFLNGDEKELRKGLKAAAVFIRGGLAKRMNLRITPELTFVRDTSLEYGAHINKLLVKVEDELAEIDACEAAAAAEAEADEAQEEEEA